MAPLTGMSHHEASLCTYLMFLIGLYCCTVFIQIPWECSVQFIWDCLFTICGTDGAPCSDCSCSGSWTQDQKVPGLPLGPRQVRRQTTNADVWNRSQHVSQELVIEQKAAEQYVYFLLHVLCHCLIYWRVLIITAVGRWFWMPSLRSRMKWTPRSHSDVPAVRVREAIWILFAHNNVNNFWMKEISDLVSDWLSVNISNIFRYLRLMCHEYKWRKHAGVP